MDAFYIFRYYLNSNSVRHLFICIVSFLFTQCSNQNKPMKQYQYTNDLIQESSPYLLQHAHNPVNWKPWSEKTLQQAKKEEKLIVVSIGYAACHWCHVMEKESFEDPQVAKLMNQNFIAIKVDREERPDVDQVYMKALQLMTGSGGWPLNMITLPDGRPVWGGTYFSKDKWTEALKQISDLYDTQPKKLIEYAEKLEEGIKTTDIIEINTDEMDFNNNFISSAIKEWSHTFDYEKGGSKRVPKFMMPNNYHFLLRYAHQNNNKELLQHVIHTLSKISFGGVYDHIGGGFSRYATDAKWHIPHFEKMLYDNAQLVSLYSDAYLATQNPWFKTIVYETLEFISKELTNKEGAFYSSLDADSTTETGELEEGAFYIWTQKELSDLLGSDYKLFSEYYNINSYGHWEKDKYVLIRKDDHKTFLKNQSITNKDLTKKIKQWKNILLAAKEKRAKPRLDDKILTSWNALMLKGYLDAYRVFGDQQFLEAAIRNAQFIKEKQLQPDNSLFHNYKEGKSSINGYLEDYASVIQSFIHLYQATFDPQWLTISEKLSRYTFTHFYDNEKGLFYFTSNLDPELISKTIESTDNVIPASNSIMAKNLFLLYHYTDNKKYLETSKQMLHNILPQIEQYPSGFSNWLDLMLNYTDKYYEIVVIGPELQSKIKKINAVYIPNKLMAGSNTSSNSPLLINRYVDGKTLIYICVDNVCKYPFEDTNQVIKEIM